MESDKVAENPESASLDTAAIIKRVYEETWASFYKWEQDDCLRTIHSLARPHPQNHATPQKSEPRSKSFTRQNKNRSAKVQESRLELDNETFAVVEYSTEGGYTSTEDAVSTLSTTTIKVLPRFKPCSPYEICTPTSRNINVEDDSEYMPFIPLADDPEFDQILHTGDYRYFEWQIPNQNPDLEVIVAETAYILYNEYQISFADIDESNILPLQLLHPPGDVLRSIRRRDLPKWGNISLQHPPLPYIPIHHDIGPNDKLQNLIRDFCTNLNCVIGYCTTHMGDMAIPEPVQPAVLSESLAYAVENPCGAECFLLGNSIPIGSLKMNGTFWNKEDAETLITVLRFSPDISPCDLAVICRKPCQEVYKQRRLHIPDPLVQKSQEKANRSRPTRYSSLRYRAIGPVATLAHVTHDLNAPVFSTPHTVRTAAGVIKNVSAVGEVVTVYLRRRSVERQGVPAIAPTASVILLCVLNAMQNPEAGCCKNVSLQSQQQKKTEVRISQWGLGFFLTEAAEQEDLIIEYTGELILEPTTICRDFVSKHRGRSYVFQLNSTLAIDSGKAGNESRFINHGFENANCHASIRLVNGEHRIGLFASKRLEPGTEILLNYGDEFFKSEPANTEGEAKPKGPSPSPAPTVYLLDQHSSDETYSE